MFGCTHILCFVIFVSLQPTAKWGLTVFLWRSCSKTICIVSVRLHSFSYWTLLLCFIVLIIPPILSTLLLWLLWHQSPGSFIFLNSPPISSLGPFPVPWISQIYTLWALFFRVMVSISTLSMMSLYQFAGTAIKKHQILGGLNNRNQFSYSFGG